MKDEEQDLNYRGLGKTIEEWKKDPLAFEMALSRVRDRAEESGATPTFGELIRQAEKELQVEEERLRSGRPFPARR